MKINTVALCGAGAVGSYFVWGLAEKLGENFCVIAEGERKIRLEQDGLLINGKCYRPTVKTPKEACGADLLLIATKYGSLNGILDGIAEITTRNTTVMSLLNGIGSEEKIGERIGMEHMLYSVIKIAAERNGNRISFDNEKTVGVIFGEAGQKKESERMKAIGDLFGKTPLHWAMSRDIIREVWQKFALNVGYNLPQAILGCGVGAYRDSVYAKHLLDSLIDEVVTVAAAKGIDIASPAEALKQMPLSTKSAKYSTLQDLEAKRRTEIDIFAGAMVNMGKELDIPTPYNDFAYNAIKALEEKNENRFDY